MITILHFRLQAKAVWSAPNFVAIALAVALRDNKIIRVCLVVKQVLLLTVLSRVSRPLPPNIDNVACLCFTDILASLATRIAHKITHRITSIPGSAESYASGSS